MHLKYVAFIAEDAEQTARHIIAVNGANFKKGTYY